MHSSVYKDMFPLAEDTATEYRLITTDHVSATEFDGETIVKVAPEALAQLVSIRGAAPVYAIAVSPAKAGRLSSHFSELSALFMNAREARGLAGLPSAAPILQAAKTLQISGLRAGVITEGGDS